MQHHVTVNVSPALFADNVRTLRREVAPSRLCVVMKADAYGHGLEALAPVAAEAGADAIGICTNPEAETVRRLLPRMPIMRLRAALPDELEASVASLGVEEQVGSLDTGRRLDALARQHGRPVPVHLLIDTGMGRSGFLPDQAAAVRETCRLPGLRVVGIMTHLANADAPDLGSAERQLQSFWRLRRTLDDVLPEDVLTHTHNSAAALRLPQQRADLVRVGAACYGVRTSRAFENPEKLVPVMSIRTRVMEVRTLPAGSPIGYGSRFRTSRESCIASLPMGFGEGYPRALFNKGIVLVGGLRCPVVGRVSLNVTTVDVTDLPTPPQVGDDVVLIGRQGRERVTFEEMAERFDSVHTELNLMAGHMNERSYADDPDA